MFNSRKLLAAIFVIFVSPLTLAQAGSSGTPKTEGVSSAGYTIHQSTELGYRYMESTGSMDMYNTLVDLHTGPRVLEQTLSMQSENHQGLLFDDLYLNSGGWGGDPDNILRTRVGKNRWYEFSGSFRRDRNFFDYDLLVNPLNPSASVPAVPVFNSPHRFETGRRLSDFDLKLLPQSFVSFRLGYSHNNMSGPSYSSIHEGSDASLFQNWNTTLSSYRAGMDVKVAPRTVVSYDQFLDYYKGDTRWTLGSFYPATLSNGGGVEFGLPFNTASSQPCATPILGTGFANPGCSGYFDYQRNERARNSFTTEQASFRSSYWKRLDLLGLVSYSGGDARIPAFNEIFSGLITRNRTRDSLQAGAISSKRITVTAESGMAWHITDRLRLIDNFRFENFRIPGAWQTGATTLFGATLLSNPNVFDLATCPPPFTAATCPQHNASSGPDVAQDFLNTFLKQDQKTNTTQLQYDLTSKVSARLGYAYTRRHIAHDLFDYQVQTFYPTLATRGACASQPLVNGVCTVAALSQSSDPVEIRGNSLLAGFSARPVNTLRFNFDLERVWNDESLTRISPRKELRYRMQTTYTPRPWAVVSGSANVLENANADLLTDYRGHTRNFGFNTSLAPYARFGLDLAYNYNDIMQNALVCFNDTPPTGVVLPVVTNATSCATLDSSNPLLTDSYYINHTHFGLANLVFKPAKRLTTNMGYSITSVAGDTPQFNALQPLGSLAYNYHQPVAGFSLDLGHNLAWNAAWNYYQYNDKSFVGPTASRYFHANTATASLRYAF